MTALRGVLAHTRRPLPRSARLAVFTALRECARRRGRRAAHPLRRRGPALRGMSAALPVPRTMVEVAQGFASSGAGGAPPFMYWQKHCAESPQFTPQDVMRAMCPVLSAAEIAAYAAPFPDERFAAGAR